MKKSIALFGLFLILAGSGCNRGDIRETGQAATDGNAPIDNVPAEQLEATFDPTYNYTAIMTTNLGQISLKLFANAAPKTVENFVKLSQSNFYDGVKFHRVISDFMIQSGDPKSKDEDCSDDGTGGPGYDFPDEINDYTLVRGRLAMANRGPNTNGSQFFIVTATSTPWLDGLHTVFGEISSGMDVVDTIEGVATNPGPICKDRPIDDVIIQDIEIVEQ